jgi:hypothetical protein
MNHTVITYIAYLLVSIPLTVWVARTLFKNSRVFLVDCFRGNEALADSVNHLLVVGFYLLNIGFVTLYLKIGVEILDARGVFEALSTKVGTVLIVLGVMHFFNVWLFAKVRKRATLHEAAPPVLPDAVRADLTL